MNTKKRLDRLEKAMKELASRLGWEITLYPSGSVYVSPKGGSNIMENIYKLDQRRIEKTKIKLSSLRLDALSDALGYKYETVEPQKEKLIAVKKKKEK